MSVFFPCLFPILAPGATLAEDESINRSGIRVVDDEHLAEFGSHISTSASPFLSDLHLHLHTPSPHSISISISTPAALYGQ